MQDDFLTESKEDHNFLRKEMKNALAYIQSNFQDPDLTVERIAKAASVSQDTLESMFRKWKNITVIQYLLEQRLESVKRMLAETDEPINFIASSTGFSDPSYLDRAFKKHYGITPTAFRKKSKLLRKKS